MWMFPFLFMYLYSHLCFYLFFKNSTMVILCSFHSFFALGVLSESHVSNHVICIFVSRVNIFDGLPCRNKAYVI